ncbi:B12-binding domain-containing radical SAM protein [Marinomonas ostreistagni]|uniref:B12-binding domain-containing radical SAM protein n=1 Tax=Marinomonas ostreistagni TaxID=359209 RepID=A0ABS0Z655_9GAMM|nr:radical SAM protein [Marinomonas ostreistagni]MBJ7549139.1 B12-binding domain-containing radical SAM protein [Marinomonas ostreistagni]
MNTNNQQLHWQKVAIWGAALSGAVCFDALMLKQIEVSLFIDKYPPANGRFKDRPVISSEAILADLNTVKDVDAIILTMGAGATELKNHLRELGFQKDIVTYRQGLNIDDVLKVQSRIVPRKILQYDGSDSDQNILKWLATEITNAPQPVAFYITNPLSEALLLAHPELAAQIITSGDWSKANSLFVNTPDYIASVDARHDLEEQNIKIPTLYFDELIKSLPSELIREQMWHEPEYSIYPVDIPAIRFESGLDMLLLDLPGRMLGMLPNGLGYVHNILKGLGINFQTVDLDMIIYHRYHSNRILDDHKHIYSPSGKEMPADPWAIAFIEDSWKDPDFVSYFDELLDKISDRIVQAAPKIIGFSLNGTNTLIVQKIVRKIRPQLPDTKVIVGGYECINPEVGPKIFDDYDYMVIFEAEGSLPDLIQLILDNKKVIGLPGVISKDEGLISGNTFTPAHLVEDLDPLGYPTYEWADINLYKNYNGYQLVPILLSRGCKWSKCTFCGERFSWRRRSPQSLADEIEFLVSKGANNFHFNDSDLSGDPMAVRELCEEIIRRGITGITMAGQLRVQKGYTPDYFEVLRKAGFNYLRYGIDGWSKNTLKLHKKGYTAKHIAEVIEMTKAAGILVAINLVIGIPHETEEDIDETIDNIRLNAANIDTIENINTLMLIAGSVYWEKPEELGMRFNEDLNDLYRQFPKYIPYKYWHSVDPYIDQDVRLARLKRILDAASELNIRVGSYAEWSSQNAKKI